MTSEKTDKEQRRATQNNARRHRSATQRATRRPGQPNPLPRAEAIRHGQTRQLCHTARPGRSHWPSDLAASHPDGPPGPTPPGPDTPGSAADRAVHRVSVDPRGCGPPSPASYPSGRRASGPRPSPSLGRNRAWTGDRVRAPTSPPIGMF
jgi:hypothetical protein